jgi:hypothetical protein
MIADAMQIIVFPCRQGRSIARWGHSRLRYGGCAVHLLDWQWDFLATAFAGRVHAMDLVPCWATVVGKQLAEIKQRRLLP